MYKLFVKLSVFTIFVLAVYIEEGQRWNIKAKPDCYNFDSLQKYVDNMFSTPYPYSFGIIAAAMKMLLL